MALKDDENTLESLHKTYKNSRKDEVPKPLFFLRRMYPDSF